MVLGFGDGCSVVVGHREGSLGPNKGGAGIWACAFAVRAPGMAALIPCGENGSGS